MTDLARRGFTLLEILVVIAIVSILSSIAIVNFSTAQVRTKVSRAKADMQVIVTGLETYYVDNDRYPPNRRIPLSDASGPSEAAYPASGYNVTPVEITTPIAYITSNPPDPFRDQRGFVYDFFFPDLAEQIPQYSYYQILEPVQWEGLNANGITVSLVAVGGEGANRGAFAKYGGGQKPAWVIWSAGPDGIVWHGKDDFTAPGDPGSPLKEPNHSPWGFSFDVPYDPTNGTVSFGNIIQTRVGAPHAAGPRAAVLASQGGGGPASPPSPADSSRGGGSSGQRSGESGGGPGGRGSDHEGGQRGGVAGKDLPPSTQPPSSSATPAPPRPQAQPPQTPAEVTTGTLGESPAGLEEYVQRPRSADPPERVIPRETPSPGARAIWPFLLGLLLLALYALARRFREKKKPKIAKESYEIMDADLLKMRDLDQQTSLFLANSQVTDEGLAHLKGLTALESLDLWDTRITDAGLEHLQGLRSLKTLNLSDTRITDAGLGALDSLPSLQTLILSGTRITDAGLRYLAKLTSIREINLNQTLVSRDGIAQLQEALPGCRLRFS